MGVGEELAYRRESHSHEPHEPRVRELAGAYTAALLAGDEIAAETAIREAMDGNMSTPEIDESLIAPALTLVGELWARGEISIAEEHIATEISVRVLALQREAMRVAQSRSERRVMLATPAGEFHVVALRMVAILLRGAGYDTVMVGADVPPHALGAAARRHDAGVICMSSTMPRVTDELLRIIDEVRQEWPSVGFVIGGRGLSVIGQLRAQVHVCERISEVVEAVDAMVQRARLN